MIARKYRSADDALEAYAAHLSQPQVASGAAKASTIHRVGRRTIGAHAWVEALHDSSGLPNYLTYYVATVTSHIGVLVTFSAHRDSYGKHQSELEAMMKSLRIHQRLL